jgi:hypothetical protein
MTRAEGLGEEQGPTTVDLAAHALHMAVITCAGPRPYRMTVGEESTLTRQILGRATAFEVHLEEANARAAERRVKALAGARPEVHVTPPGVPGVA